MEHYYCVGRTSRIGQICSLEDPMYNLPSSGGSSKDARYLSTKAEPAHGRDLVMSSPLTNTRFSGI